MSTKQGPTHIVVDGSNIATEGRSMPSLAQLSEAVGSFMEEHPNTAVTVVVDATFGHRIDKREVAEFEAGIANNELVAPPAGAVGRGDAFVLGIADKAGSAVLSNDSFQEFHGQYTWLFDEGRLIGGKPVPHVGWVWVNRVPVRGPISRKATRDGSRRGGGGRTRRGSSSRDEFEVRTGSPEASAPMPTPKTPPPGRGGASSANKTPSTPAPANESVAKPPPRGSEPVNDLMPFLDFVEHHPIGSSVNGTVDAYSSHGAYITIANTGVRGYIPLRLMASPAPRSAKSVMKIDDSVTVVVVSFAAARRSIDCALPDMAALAFAESPDSEVEVGARAAQKTTATTKKAAAKRAAATKQAANRTAAVDKPAPKTAAAKQTTTKKAAAKQAVAKVAPAKKSAAIQVVAKQTATKQAAKVAPARKTAAKKTAAKKTAAKKTAAKKTAAKKAVTTKDAIDKPAVKSTAKTAGTKKVAAKRSSAKKVAARQDDR